jgi:uncharacterized protein YjdB
MIVSIRRALIASLVMAGGAWAQDVVGIDVAPVSLRMSVGETVKLTVSAFRSDGSKSRFPDGYARFALTDSLVASVDSAGRVVAHAPGTATILVTYASVQRQIPMTVIRGASQSAAAASTTAAAAAPSAPLKVVRALHIMPERMRLLPTERAHFTISAEFEDGSSGIPPAYSVAVYGTAARLDSAANEVVGTVPGEAQLGVRVAGATPVSISVQVTEASLRLDRDTLALAVGSADTIVVTTNETPSRRLYTGLLWHSTKPSVIEPLDSLHGGVRAVGPGTGDIIFNGYGVTLRLPVVTYTPVVSLRRADESRAEFALPVGLQETLGAVAIAENAAVVQNVPLRWAVADTAVATFDAVRGTLTGRREGTTTVTVRVPSVPVLSWRVRVVNAKFAIASAPAYLVIGESRQLRAVWLGPEGDTLKSSAAVSWRSSNSRSLAVSDSGRLTAAETGPATIRADFGDRYHAEAPVRVTADFLVTLDYGKDSTSVAELSIQKRTIEPLAGLAGARFAEWTPNHDKLVYSRRAGPSKTLALFTAATDGSDARQISRPREGDDVNARWFVQPDRIAFLNGRGGDFRVASQQVDDTLASTLLVRGRVRGIARRRDRDEFLVIREMNSRCSVWVATPIATEKQLVADRRGMIDGIAELPDGNMLMLADTSAGKDRYALVRWSNGVETPLEIAFQNAGRLRSMALSADGRHAVVIADHPTAKQGSVVFWVDLATRAVVEILRTDQYKVTAPDA